MNTLIAFVAIGVSFVIGTSISAVLGQNQTATNSELFATSTTNTIIAITGLIAAIAAILKTLVDRGILDKRIGTVAVMTADTSYAVKDSRQSIQDLAQNTHETVKLISPEAAKYADDHMRPAMDRVTQRVNEYIPKANKFNEIANKLGKSKSDELDKVALATGLDK